MATIPVFRTWVAGEVVTAAYFNSNVRDAGNFFLSWPVCETRQTIGQSLANNAAATLSFDTNDIDTDNAHSTSVNSSEYIAKTIGRFQVSGGCSFANNATGQRAAEVWKNGATYNGGGTMMSATNGNTHRQATRTITIPLNGTTDFVGIAGYQNSGGALATAVTSIEQPTLSVRMVGTT